MMKCALCNCTESRMEFAVPRNDIDKYAFFLEKDEYTPAVYWECAGCEAMIWKTGSEYERIYDGFAYSSETGNAVEFLGKRFREITALPPEKSDNSQRIERIRTFLMRRNARAKHGFPKRVLDVGAGMGVFLYGFLNENWRGTAIEPDPDACNQMRGIMPEAQVIQGYFNEVDPDGSFDLITLNRMLEHVANPYPILRKAKEKLKHTGCIYIELPDVRAYYCNGPHDADFGYGHYTIYSPMALAHLGTHSGLEFLSMNRVVEPSGKYTIYGFYGHSPMAGTSCKKTGGSSNEI